MEFRKNVVIVIIAALLASLFAACSDKAASVGVIGGADGDEVIITEGGGNVGSVDGVDSSEGNGAARTDTVGDGADGAADAIGADVSEQSTPVTATVTTDNTGTTASAAATTAPASTAATTTAPAPASTTAANAQAGATSTGSSAATEVSSAVAVTTAAPGLTDTPEKVLSDITGILPALGVPVPKSTEPAGVTSQNSAEILGLTETDFDMYADSASYVTAAESDAVSHFMTVIKAKDSASAAKLKELLSGADGFDKNSIGGTSPAKCAVIDCEEYLFLAASDIITVDSAIVVFSGIAGNTGEGEIVEIK